MLVFGHLGFTVLAARLTGPLLRLERWPMPALLVGALLPDLVDKPLGHALLPWDNGRLWAHTLGFGLALAAWTWWRASESAAALTFGTAVHHVLDRLPWADPATWLWPLAGDFPRDVSAGVPDWITALASDPYVWTTEGLGLLALAVLVGAPLVGWTPRWWRRRGPTEPVARPTAGDPDAEP